MAVASPPALAAPFSPQPSVGEQRGAAPGGCGSAASGVGTGAASPAAGSPRGARGGGERSILPGIPPAAGTPVRCAGGGGRDAGGRWLLRSEPAAGPRGRELSRVGREARPQHDGVLGLGGMCWEDLSCLQASRHPYRGAGGLLGEGSACSSPASDVVAAGGKPPPARGDGEPTRGSCQRPLGAAPVP